MRLHTSILSLILLVAGGMISGCATMGSSSAAVDNKLVIPDYPTAADQYKFAQMYQSGQVVSPEADRRKVQMVKAMQCYEKVLSNFPDDQNWCPRSILEIGDCWVQSGELGKAVQQYNLARERYPNDDYIQARAHFSTARTLDMQHKFVDAKVIYKHITETYGQSNSGAVRDVVGRATKLYYQVMEKPKPKKKKE